LDMTSNLWEARIPFITALKSLLFCKA
jgi:hypothetical protein